MAQRRMLSRRISLSKRVNALPIKAQVVWTWTIPYLDDYGFYTADPEDIKAEVLPKNKKITIGNIKDALEQEQVLDLIELFNHNGKAYQRYDNFSDFQTLKSDRVKQCYIPDFSEKMELDVGGIQRNPEGSLSKDKISKVKLSKYSDSFLRFWEAFKGRWNPDRGVFVKGGKMEAFDEWEKLTPAQQDLTMAAAPKTGSKSTKDACRWLKYKRWEDFETTPKPSKPKQPQRSKTKVATAAEKAELRKNLPRLMQDRLKARDVDG